MNMKVSDFLDYRNPTRKTLRVLDYNTHKNLGAWYENDNLNKIVKSIKVTNKYLFIFV